MYVGSCKNCKKSCVQMNYETYSKTHQGEGEHYRYKQAQLIKKIANFVNYTSGIAYERNVIVINDYFKNLKQKLDIIHKRKINQLESQKMNVSFSLGEQSGKKLNDYGKYIDLILNNKADKVNCDSISFLMRGIDKMIKNAKNGEKVNFKIYNNWIKTTKNQINNVVHSIENKFIDKLSNLNIQLQKQFKTYVSSLSQNNPRKIQKHPENERELRPTRQFKQDLNQRRQREQNIDMLRIKNYKKPIRLIKQAQQGCQFALKVKIQKIVTTTQSNGRKKLLFIGKDQSGSTKMNFRIHQYIEPGNQVIIDRCKLDTIHGQKKIVSVYDSDIILVSTIKNQKASRMARNRQLNQTKVQIKKQQKVKTQIQQVKNITQHQYNPRRNRGDEDYSRHLSKNKNIRGLSKSMREISIKKTDRINNSYRDNQMKDVKNEVKIVQKFRKQQEQVKCDKVQSIEPDSQNLTLVVKIQQISMQKKDKLICVIGDETAIVNAELPAKYDFILEGVSVIIKGAFAQIKQEHIVIVLQQDSKVKKSFKSFAKIGIGRNMSKQQWVEQND